MRPPHSPSLLPLASPARLWLRRLAPRPGLLATLLACALPFAFLVLSARAQTVRWEPPGGQLGFNQVTPLALVFENCEPDGDPALPKVEGLTVAGRPSQSSETSFVNFSKSTKFSLIYPVRPTRRAAINVPEFEVKTDKGMMTVKAAAFTVGDATVGNSGLAIDSIAAAKLIVPKTSFWAGEVFPVTFNLNIVRRYFYALGSNLDWQPSPLVAEDWSKPDLNETLLRGERFVVLKQDTRAYAKQPGNYTIKPAMQGVNLLVGTSGFGLFAQPTVEQRQIESTPLELSIKPLPTAPAGFTGAVGKFTFASKVVPVTAAVGEPVTWTLELTGTGNWPDITGLPEREVSNDFQVVQPKSKRAMKDATLFEGTLTEDVVLVPTRPGTYKLSPARFTYFDTETGTYKTLTSEPVTVTITAGAPVLPAAAGSGAPVQFSINPSATQATTPVLPPAVAPVAPENLPRDPITESASGRVPFKPDSFPFVVAAPAVGVVLLAWLVLAILRSRERDPQRRRREARAKLAATLAELRSAGSTSSAAGSLLRQWQQHAAVLWEVPHAAPGTPLIQARVGTHSQEAGAAWARLWSEADRAQHGREATLPADWTSRAEASLQATQVPGWPPFSLFAGRNLFPFLFTLALLLAPVAMRADAAGDAYKGGDFAAAEAGWRKALAAAPTDWTVRHNLGLALAQQDRWAEATAYWTSASLLNVRADATRWDISLGLQRSGLATPELVEFSRGEGPHQLIRWATPAEWQFVLVGAALLLAAALIVLLLQGYRRIGTWARPVALITSLVAVLLAAAATFSLHTYGPLAHPEAVIVWKASTLRSIPTEADTTQKTSPLSAGSVAIVEKTFLGSWTKLTFTGGQKGWVRTEDLIRLYR